MTRQGKKRHRTFLAQRNEYRLTSVVYARVSLYANSAQRPKLLRHKFCPVSDSCSFSSSNCTVLIKNKTCEWPTQTPSTTMRESHSATITTVTPSSVASKSQSGQRSTTVGSIYTMHNMFRNHSNTNPLCALLSSIHTWGMPLAMFSAFPISSGLAMPTLPRRFISYSRRRPYDWHTTATRPLPF